MLFTGWVGQQSFHQLMDRDCRTQNARIGALPKIIPQ
jgi:hypothetical protein